MKSKNVKKYLVTLIIILMEFYFFSNFIKIIPFYSNYNFLIIYKSKQS